MISNLYVLHIYNINLKYKDTLRIHFIIVLYLILYEITLFFRFTFGIYETQ